MSIDPLALGRPAADLLAELTVEQLTQIAANYDIRGQRRKADWVSVLVDVLSDPLRLQQALGTAPPGVGELVEQLTWHTPHMHGPVQFALHGTHRYSLPLTTMWLTEHGFLLPSGWDSGQMPREVSLALRGADHHPILTIERPVLTTTDVDPMAIPQASVVDGVQRMLTMLGTDPAQQLAAGGVGVRELRRIAKELGSTVGEVRLWLELAAAGGPLRPDGDGDVLPTNAADIWLATPPGAQLVDLIAAWRTIDIVPSYCVNAEGKPLPALDVGGAIGIGPPLRTDVLALLAAYPVGTVIIDVDSLVDVIVWRYPLRYHSAEVLGPYLTATWCETQRLGLVGDASLSALGRAVATGAGRSELLDLAGQILPAPVGHATFLPDLHRPPAAAADRILDQRRGPAPRPTAGAPGVLRRLHVRPGAGRRDRRPPQTR